MRNRDRRAISPAMTGAAMILVGLFVGGGAFYVGQASADTPTLQVQTSDHINSLGSAKIQVHIEHGTASSYAVTIEVATPNVGGPVPLPAGGPFCDTVTITTDGGGNGHATVSYPDTGAPTALFTASACTPAGKGGPNTELAGTYTVTVSSTPAITSGTLSTTFAVLPPRGVVTASGGFSATNAPTTYRAVAVSGGYQGCSGTLTGPLPAPTTTQPTTYPSIGTRYGSVTLTGTVSSNTPGQVEAHQIYNPCVSTTVTYSSIRAVWTFSDVTICLGTVSSGGACVGDTVSGGLIFSFTTEITATVTGSTTTTINFGQNTYTGTGRLEGLSGTGPCVTTTVTPAAAVGTCMAQLMNVPGAGDE